MGAIPTFFQMQYHTAAFARLNVQHKQSNYLGALVVDFFLTFPSHKIRIISSGNGSNGSRVPRPRKRDDRSLNLAERCLPPLVRTRIRARE